jgi:hypothetical protein
MNDSLRSSLRGALPVLFIALSCAPEPEVIVEDCLELPCMIQRLLPAFDQDASATLARLAERGPVEQEALVRHLIEARPDQLEEICRGLGPDSAAWSVCVRLRDRPHLIRGRRAEPAPAPGERAASGPAQRHPPVPASAPDASRSDPLVRDCQQRFVGDQRQLSECLFRGAEALADAERWGASERVVQLCVAAGDFSHGCLHHSISKLLPDVPAADRAAPEDLEESLAALASIEAAVGPALAPLYRDFYWSIWTVHSFLHAETIDGRLLRVLPPEAHPHVRMAAVHRALQRQPPERWAGLEASVEHFSSLLEQAGTARAGSAHRPDKRKARDLWPDDLVRGGEDRVPAVFCLGPGRRPTSDDPGMDLQLAVLEASARLSSPPPASFYLEVLEGDGPDVLRWTALRVLGALYPERAAALDMSDEAPLLRVRAEQPVRDG